MTHADDAAGPQAGQGAAGASPSAQATEAAGDRFGVPLESLWRLHESQPASAVLAAGLRAREQAGDLDDKKFIARRKRDLWRLVVDAVEHGNEFGKLVATGIEDGARDETEITPGRLRAATPDFDDGVIAIGPILWRGVRLRGVRLRSVDGGAPVAPAIAEWEATTKTAPAALAPPVQRKRGGGPREKYDWASAEAVVLRRLEDDGAPADGDGGQAELERLAASTFHPDRTPSESLIRTRVKQTIVAFRKSR